MPHAERCVGSCIAGPLLSTLDFERFSRVCENYCPPPPPLPCPPPPVPPLFPPPPTVWREKKLQSNRQYVMDFVGNLLLSSFPNLTKAQVAGFVSGLLTSDSDLNSFKLHLRDFLVTLKVGGILFFVEEPSQVESSQERYMCLYDDTITCCCLWQVRGGFVLRMCGWREIFSYVPVESVFLVRGWF